MLRKSAFYAPLVDRPFERLARDRTRRSGWRTSTRSIPWACLSAEASAAAEKAETSRDFTPTVRGVTVGLSTGTSGARGVFMVSPAERQRWAGTMLAKLLEGVPWRPTARRVAAEGEQRAVRDAGRGADPVPVLRSGAQLPGGGDGAGAVRADDSRGARACADARWRASAKQGG